MKVTVLAPAKLNLFLDITGRRNDGYHIVNMVMQSVSLYDEVTVTVNSGSERIIIECSDESVPCDETNTAYKAAVKFFEHTNIAPVGVSIKIKKRIPSQAGMAGGSTDAAAVLAALNEMLEAGLDDNELADIAEEVGADVPFCIYGGTMTADGIGTILSPLPDMPDCTIVAVKPDTGISTKAAYEACDKAGYDNVKSPDKVIQGICSGDVSEIGAGMYNKFEEVSAIPETEDIKSCMLRFDAEGACMTGSGSVVFGIFSDSEKAEDCIDELSEKYERIYKLAPVAHGVKII